MAAEVIFAEVERLLGRAREGGLSLGQARLLAAALSEEAAAPPALGHKGSFLRPKKLDSLKLSLRSRNEERATDAAARKPADGDDDSPEEDELQRRQSGSRTPSPEAAAPVASPRENAGRWRGTGATVRNRPEWRSDLTTDAGDDGPAPPPDDPLPAGWTAHYDARCGREYFHNKRLGETSWARPGPAARENQRAPRVQERKASRSRPGPAAADKQPTPRPGATAQERHRTLWRPAPKVERFDDRR